MNCELWCCTFAAYCSFTPAVYIGFNTPSVVDSCAFRSCIITLGNTMALKTAYCRQANCRIVLVAAGLLTDHMKGALCRYWEVLLKRNTINIKLLARVWQFLVRLQQHHCIWCHAGLFNFSRPSLPVLWLNSDSPFFSKFLWPGLNQLSPEKSTNFFNRITSKLQTMHGFCKIVVIVNILSYCGYTGKGNTSNLWTLIDV